MHELRGAPEPTLADLIAQISPCDLLLIEGFKREPVRKLEIHRNEVAEPWLFPDDPNIVAVASDTPAATALPQFGLEDIVRIAEFVQHHAAPHGA